MKYFLIYGAETFEMCLIVIVIYRAVNMAIYSDVIKILEDGKLRFPNFTNSSQATNMIFTNMLLERSHKKPNLNLCDKRYKSMCQVV